MPFGMIGRVGPRMCNVNRGIDRPTEMGNFGVDMGRSIVTNGEFVALLCENV